jgi:hypothetical protein
MWGGGGVVMAPHNFEGWDLSEDGIAANVDGTRVKEVLLC